MDKFWDNMMDKYDTALGFVKDLILPMWTEELASMKIFCNSKR